MSLKQQQHSSDVRSKQRLFGSAENAIIKTSQQHHGYMKVGQVLHLQGPYISLETLTTAVSHLQRRHPFLRSRLENNPAKLGSYLMQEDDTLRLKIVEIPRKREDHLSVWRQEWQEREKAPAVIGQGLMEVWLLQDPNDRDNELGLTEIVLVCEHSICDGLSFSVVAHELLMALSGSDIDMFDVSLNWPITMEAAVQRSLPAWRRLVAFSRFVFTAVYWHAIKARHIGRIPLANVDFSLDDMTKYCHTEVFHGTLNMEETQKLFEKCRREGVTVTSAVSSAILRTISTIVDVNNEQATQLLLAIAADTRRRCTPPIPNHDLSYQVSGLMAFTMPTSDAPTTPQDMWQLGRAFGEHVKRSTNAGQILALAMIIGTFYNKNLGPIDISKLPTCGISNWGVLPFHEQYGKWKLVATSPFGNMIRAAMPFFVVQTVNGVLTIGCLGSVPIIPSSTLENLCSGAIHNLQQMLDN